MTAPSITPAIAAPFCTQSSEMLARLVSNLTIGRAICEESYLKFQYRAADRVVDIAA